MVIERPPVSDSPTELESWEEATPADVNPNFHNFPVSQLIAVN